MRTDRHNAAQVVRKLAELQLVEVLFTTNGKEYLTPKQLHNEAPAPAAVCSHAARAHTPRAPIGGG